MEEIEVGDLVSLSSIYSNKLINEHGIGVVISVYDSVYQNYADTNLTYVVAFGEKHSLFGNQQGSNKPLLLIQKAEKL